MKIICQLAILLALGCSLTQGQEVRSIYGEKCANCHGADGSGNTELGRTLKLLRDLRSPEAQKLSDSKLIKIIASGMDRGTMPGYQKELGPDMVQQLATYVRSLSTAPPVAHTGKATNPERSGQSASSKSVNPSAQSQGKEASSIPLQKQVELGRQFYLDRHCNLCHTINRKGGSAGPDLRGGQPSDA
jgi:mono/diheme cytochrome c family protein